MFELKRLSDDAIPAALEKALRYCCASAVSIEIGPDTNVSATAAVAKNGQRVLLTWKACFFIGCVSS